MTMRVRTAILAAASLLAMQEVATAQTAVTPPIATASRVVPTGAPPG